MYWKITKVWSREEGAAQEDCAGAFVMHRHQDEEGLHLDLRLEHGESLLGWRIGGEELEEGLWATEKMPHPVAWLHSDQGLQRCMEGHWCWEERKENACTVALRDGEQSLYLRLERCDGIGTEAVRALAEMAKEKGISFSALAGLAEDGLHARSREVTRFCALSRTLDGEGFDEEGWRGLFAGMSLREISERLARVEIRYDKLCPPQPVSQPEALTEEDQSARTREAYRIIHS
ncbi:MAG: hypothetical protein GX130_13290 [Candidatus Hydrogenedens sp.]|jgi:hypothetical protein|nr:hypothetical protein [Candidatus Hydrogenedens sp.]